MKPTSHLPVTSDDTFPEMTVAGTKAAVVYRKYTKEWWLAQHGNAGKFRTWTNPTQDVQRFEMHVDIPRWIDPDTVPENERMITVEFQPGETIELPQLRHWDLAIVRIHNGAVVGGLAPRLRAAGMNVEMDPGLAHFDGEPFASESP